MPEHRGFDVLGLTDELDTTRLVLRRLAGVDLAALYVLDAVSTQLLGAVERLVGFLEHRARRPGSLRVQHCHARADGEHTSRVGGMQDTEALNAGSHALDRPRAALGRLLGEDAQELFPAISIERVSAAGL